MNLARDHFLADAALAAQQHADVVVGHAIDHRHHGLHRFAGAPARLRAVGILADLRAQALHLARQRQALERVADRRFERDFADAVGIAGLHHIVGGAKANRFDDRRRCLSAREHHDLRGRMREPDLPQGVEAVEPGHQHVEQDDVGQRAFAQSAQQRVAALIGRRSRSRETATCVCR